VKATGLTNVRAPIALDALHSVWPIAPADGIICINMTHISPWEATVGLIKGGPPYSLRDRRCISTVHTNAKDSKRLRATKRSTGAFAIVTRPWGLRDLEAVAAMARSVGFSAPVITEMPGNNLSMVFHRM
jgi:Protein of unknown function (DUF938)